LEWAEYIGRVHFILFFRKYRDILEIVDHGSHIHVSSDGYQ
jgi:hypothetical protein